MTGKVWSGSAWESKFRDPAYVDSVPASGNPAWKTPKAAYVYVTGYAAKGLHLGNVPEVLAVPHSPGDAWVRWWPPFDRDVTYPKPANVYVTWDAPLKRYTNGTYYRQPRFHWTKPQPSDRAGITLVGFEEKFNQKAAYNSANTPHGPTAITNPNTHYTTHNYVCGLALLDWKPTDAIAKRSFPNAAYLYRTSVHGSEHRDRTFWYGGSIEFLIRAKYSDGQYSDWVSSGSVPAPTMYRPNGGAGVSSVINSGNWFSSARYRTYGLRQRYWNGKAPAGASNYLKPAYWMPYKQSGKPAQIGRTPHDGTFIDANNRAGFDVMYSVVQMYYDALHAGPSKTDPVGGTVGPIGMVTEELFEFKSASGRPIPTLAQVKAGQYRTNSGRTYFYMSVPAGRWYVFDGEAGFNGYTDVASYFNPASGARQTNVGLMRFQRRTYGGPHAPHYPNTAGTFQSIAIGDDRWGGSIVPTHTEAGTFAPWTSEGKINTRLWRTPTSGALKNISWTDGSGHDIHPMYGQWAVLNAIPRTANVTAFLCYRFYGIYGGVKEVWVQVSRSAAGTSSTSTTGATAVVAAGHKYAATTGAGRAVFRYGPRSGTSSAWAPGPLVGGFTVPAGATVTSANVWWHSSQYQGASNTRGIVIVIKRHGSTVKTVVATSYAGGSASQAHLTVHFTGARAGDVVYVGAWGTGWKSNVQRTPGPTFIFDRVEWVTG